ncbi:MAG: 2-amino-4-hydroxy-6-hydroxymethyldihydropteridine diphosphokinase [Phycisphaerae bacterium]|nr:2-amino-4-hydroxy-6-hydroxymethyldihydropteridine diphosphokinase [Phycisphaerae bacterium]
MSASGFAIGIGSNLGDRAGQIDRGLELLAGTPGVRWCRSGPRILTEPVLPEGIAGEHPIYLNTVAIGRTILGPRSLLARLLAIETSMGRRRRGGCDPRTLDLDLLVLEGVCIAESGIEVPHPRLEGRNFVLDPLKTLLDDCRIDPNSEIRETAESLSAVIPGMKERSSRE